MENPNIKNAKPLSAMLPDVTKLTDKEIMAKLAIPCTTHEVVIADSENTRQVTAQPRPFNVRYDGVVMTKQDLEGWLEVLNKDLFDAGAKLLTPLQCKGFARMLLAGNYTWYEAEVASKFIVFGRKKNFKADGQVLAEYFYPSHEDMLPFFAEFYPADEIRANEAELKRQFAQERASLRGEIKKKQLLCDQLAIDLSTAKQEPHTKFVLSETEREELSLVKQLRKTQDEKAAHVVEIRKLKRAIVKLTVELAEERAQSRDREKKIELAGIEVTPIGAKKVK